MTTAFLALLIAGLAGAVVGLLWVAGRQNVVADEGQRDLAVPERSQ